MSTSGSVDFLITRNDIIKMALQTIGAIAEGETPSADAYTDASNFLNILAKNWQSDGLQLWLVKTGTMSLTSGDGDYTMGAGGNITAFGRPIKILECAFRDSSGNDTPIDILSREEYVSINDKDSAGTPSSIFYDPYGSNLNLGIIYTWPVVNSTGNYLYLKTMREVEDFDSSTDNPDFPKEWYLPLVYGLSTLLAPIWGVGRLDRKQLIELTLMYKASAMAADIEGTSIYIGIDNG